MVGENMVTEKKRKIGIMGGTFDPIHIGHLILAENAQDQFGLEKILVMPSGNPPHKRNRKGRADNEQRIEMVRRAIEGNPHLELSLEEMNNSGYTYTKETLERITSENSDCEYYFIIGADSLFSFDTWYEPQRICELCVLLVAIRDNVDLKAFEEKAEEVRQKYHARLLMLRTPNIEVSSHDLRSWIRDKKSVRYFLPDSVISYIQEEGLYQEGDLDEC